MLENPFKRPRKPTAEDWAQVGGKPDIHIEGRLTYVTHHLSDDEDMVVRSHIPIDQMGTVVLNVDGEMVEFPVAMLRQFHGLPCETRSRTNGGDGYERIRREK